MNRGDQISLLNDLIQMKLCVNGSLVLYNFIGEGKSIKIYKVYCFRPIFGFSEQS